MMDGGPRALGSASATAVPSRPSGTILGKDDFLRLLVAQLRHQNPMDPIKQDQFLLQTAQFAALEELQRLSRAVEALEAASTAAAQRDVAQLLGRPARAAGREFAFDGLSPARLDFRLDEPAVVTVEILGAEGELVRRLDGGGRPAGVSSVAWDGLDAAGRPAAAGTYVYRVLARGPGGQPRLAVVAEGRVEGVQIADGGARLLLGNARVRPADLVELR
jgi:flagellar basal-body rod modification protein FlgD